VESSVNLCYPLINIICICEVMYNLNRLLVLGLIATAAVFVGGLVNTLSLQEAEAVSCDRSVVAVCGVCVNANVIGQEVSQRCNQ
jgi:hypothetical protein